MYKKTTALSVAISLALGTAAAFAPVAAQAEEQQVEKLQKMKVTGSRISTTDMEGPSPVTVINSKDIESKGFNSAQDVLNSLTQNTGGVMAQTDSFTFTPAAQSVNLRGLGASRTLILIDGRRLPQYPLAEGGTSNFQDIGQIPVAAIERVEVMTDSGSAIYGSDAIGGVVNFILKKDFDGASVKIRAGDATDGDYQNGRLDVVAGKDFEDKRILFVGQFAGNEMLKQTDRDWAGNDASDRSLNSAYSSYGSNFYGSNGTLTPDDTGSSCKEVVGEAGVALPDGRCGFNRSAYRTLKPENQQVDLLLRGEMDINDNLTAMAEARYGYKSTESEFEPNPYSVIVDDTHFRGEGQYTRRMVEFGPRESNTEADSYSFTVGLNGLLADTYDWDLSAGYSEQKVEENNPALYATLDEAVQNGTVDLLDTISQDVVDQYSGTSSSEAYSKLYSLNGSIAGDLIELPAGMSGFAVYGEWNRTDYYESVDATTAAGLFSGIGGTAGGGDRDQIGLGVEALIPILEDLEMTVAGRYDHYFDDSATGGAFTPKVALAYRPTDTLLLRGSYGLGFRAPDLKRLFGEKTRAYGSGFDPVLCAQAGGSGPQDSEQYSECGTQYYDVLTGPNSELEEETSTNINLGLAWEPVDDLGLTVDWYHIKMEDVVTAPSSQQVVLDPDKYAGAEVIRNADGTIKSVSFGPVNQASEKRSGIDLAVTYAYDTNEYGSFNTRVALTKILIAEYQESDREPVTDEIDFMPEYTATLNLGWAYEDVTVNLFGKYRDRMCSAYANNYYYEDCDAAKDAGANAEIASMTTWNLTASYQFNESGRVTVGAINMFDKAPPADPLSGTSPFYADGYDDPIGRQLYVEASYDF